MNGEIDLEKKNNLATWTTNPLERSKLFIEAINILIEDYNKSNFQAIILGSDQGRNVYSKKLFSLVERYQLNKRVKFVPYCKEMPIAYSISDIVVSSSVEPEAFGRVAVEAQGNGKTDSSK